MPWSPTLRSSSAFCGGSERVPGAADVRLGRPLVPDGETDDITAVQSRVREEELAAPVDAIHDRLVLLVRAFTPKADHRERPRRAELPTGLVPHPALEELSEADRFPDPLLQSLAAVAAEDGPQLERPEAASERQPVVREALRLVAGAKVFGHETEGRAKRLRLSRPEERAVHRREQPLVRVDDERVRAADARLRPAQLGAHPRRPRVGRVDVQPDP